MDENEESNYIHQYQQLLFQNTESIADIANVKRKCLVQTYSSSLKLLNNEDTLDLLKTNLDKYNKIISDNGIYSNVVAKTMSFEEYKNRIDYEWHSNLDNVDTKFLVKPLSCSNNDNLKCRKVQDNMTDQNFQDFMKLFNHTRLSKPDVIIEQKQRKIAKSFAPQSCKKNFRVPSFEKAAPSPIECIEPKPLAFRSALDELYLHNSKRMCGNSDAQTSNQLSIRGGHRKKLGVRGGNCTNKFVSPMLSNNKSEEDLILKQYDVTDERLKHIEPRMVELIRSEIMDNNPLVNWDDICGLEFAKSAIQEAVVWPLLRPDIFIGLRKPPKGILLFGPPGTGKTLIGKCVASQSKSTFFSISASSLTSKWIGDGEKMVRALFTVARCHQPAVIFIDEIDSLLSQRSDTEHECSRRIKTEFLVQLDGATTDSNERLLVIGATNRPQELDEAARRRFVKRLYIPLPELLARKQIVTKLIVKEHHNLNEEDIREISELSDGYSGADMKTLCSEASLGPIRCIDMSKIQSVQATEVRPINMSDFTKALARVKSSVSPDDLNQYLVWNNTYGSGCGI